MKLLTRFLIALGAMIGLGISPLVHAMEPKNNPDSNGPKSIATTHDSSQSSHPVVQDTDLNTARWKKLSDASQPLNKKHSRTSSTYSDIKDAKETPVHFHILDDKAPDSSERTFVITHHYVPNPPPQNIPPTSKHEQDDVLADTPTELDTANN